MNNLEKYNRVFCEVLSLENDFDKKSIKMNVTADWDSVGHMTLITQLEDTFDVMFEMEDILEFSSYEKGIEILRKYGIDIEG